MDWATIRDWWVFGVVPTAVVMAAIVGFAKVVQENRKLALEQRKLLLEIERLEHERREGWRNELDSKHSAQLDAPRWPDSVIARPSDAEIDRYSHYDSVPTFRRLSRKIVEVVAVRRILSFLAWFLPVLGTVTLMILIVQQPDDTTTHRFTITNAGLCDSAGACVDSPLLAEHLNWRTRACDGGAECVALPAWPLLPTAVADTLYQTKPNADGIRLTWRCGGGLITRKFEFGKPIVLSCLP